MWKTDSFRLSNEFVTRWCSFLNEILFADTTKSQMRNNKVQRQFNQKMKEMLFDMQLGTLCDMV